MTENVFLILQDNEEARPIVEAVARDNKDANIHYEPGMVRLESPGGNLDEDDDQFVLAWG